MESGAAVRCRVPRGWSGPQADRRRLLTKHLQFGGADDLVFVAARPTLTGEHLAAYVAT